MTQEIIEALKKNTVVFGELTEEEQSVFEVAGWKNCLFRGHEGWRNKMEPEFNHSGTVKLKPDYQLETEIVEQEIVTHKGQLCRRFYIGTDWCHIAISNVINNPDFIGFKFEGGEIAPYPIKYAIDEHNLNYTFLGKIDARKFEVLHATHVLFKK